MTWNDWGGSWESFLWRLSVFRLPFPRWRILKVNVASDEGKFRIFQHLINHNLWLWILKEFDPVEVESNYLFQLKPELHELKLMNSRLSFENPPKQWVISVLMHFEGERWKRRFKVKRWSDERRDFHNSDKIWKLH